MSGPTFTPPVLARIDQIRAQIGAVAGTPAASGPVGVTAAGGSSFASELASVSAASRASSASSGTVAAMPTSWTIPWADPTKVPKANPAAFSVPATASAATASTPAARGGLQHDVVWPLNGRITQKFGPTTCTLEPAATVNGKHYAHYHDGLDIAAAKGTPVKSMAAGTVEFAGRYPDGAEVVRVRHSDGSVALYAHLETDLKVKAGDTVAAGQVIGHVGMTGHTTGPHLHVELTSDGHKVDPLAVIRSGGLPGTPKTTTSPDPTVWTARSPLASSNAKLTAEGLAVFDKVASTIKYHDEIRDAAVRAGIDPLFLASLVKHESGFRANAVSYAGAQGLCQLMPATWKSMGVTDPYDPVQNLRAGARYIANNLKIFGRADLALAAYHDGKGAVRAAGGVPDRPVTHKYIDRILYSWKHYREAAA